MPYNLSLVLPCYNEEKNISILCEEFLKLPFQDIQAELILVNNGSVDQTFMEIKEAIKILKKVKHSKRVNKTKIAMKKAINHAKVAIKEAKKIV